MKSEIIPYSGFANHEKIYIAGHAFKSYNLGNVREGQRRLHNFLQMIRRYRLRPLKDMPIDVQINGSVHTVTTNSKGFFSGVFPSSGNPKDWEPYKLKLDGMDKTVEGQFLAADRHSVGVISDIDDTLIVSHATRLLKKVALMLFKNAYSRKTVPNIDEFYEKIKSLNDGKLPNDFFYVSNSEWNLFDLLHNIFYIHHLPEGIFLLNELKVGLWELVRAGNTHSKHKINIIKFLLKFYPDKQFILLGDNGQKDMTIYSEICTSQPHRIKGVLIRILKRKGMEQYHAFEERITGLDIPVGYLSE